MQSSQIRENFLRFFESNGHLRVASSSLIPVGDPTLLLTSAGMVQFKPYFAGEAVPPNRRLTSVQKSFRTTDIEEVGDNTHLTLFEMLGNFSIGDYFKEGAITFAIECLDKVMGLPKEKFAATAHNSDDEAVRLWQKAGIPTNRIFKFGDASNWWGPAGNEGPCGPCAELHYDFGPDKGCLLESCGPNCENRDAKTGGKCGRFLEIWNLVFMQFYHHLDGHRTPLPAPSVDTGMGLERLAIILQGVKNIYETDLYLPIIAKVEQITGKEYGESDKTQYAIRVVAEHGRSAAFLIADGVVPGNEGRGYVLRRIIRRAIRHGRQLGLQDPFLGQIATVVTDKMGEAYPELRRHAEFVQTVLKLEEERFHAAFQNGYSILMDELGKSKTLAGEIIFRLWDTYGFPVEMTQEIAKESGIEADIAGFKEHMDAQRKRARASAHFGGDRSKAKLYEALGVGGTAFLGYEQLKAETVVVGIIANNQVVTEAKEGDEVDVVLVQTPFYPEGGGQVGDSGQIAAAEGKVEVTDTQKALADMIVHTGKVTKGRLFVGQKVDAVVDTVRREDTARNHTATHMLHAALRQVLGPHVRQAGSYVAPERLRFDFSHVEPLTAEQAEQVQYLVNEKIRHNARVQKSEDTYAAAIRKGALAFFGDRYGDRVRLVEISNGATFSFEVCGGTHVHQTGELGSVFIVGETSVGAGMRRIEAVSGRGAERLVRERLNASAAVASMLQTPVGNLKERVQGLVDELAELRRQKEALERKLSMQSASGLLDRAQDVNGVKVLTTKVDASSADSLREMGDWLRDKLHSGVVALGAVVNDSPVLIAMVTQDLVARGLNASEIARTAAKEMQGGGGGRPDVAQAGGKRADKLGDALSMVPNIVRQKTAAK